MAHVRHTNATPSSTHLDPPASWLAADSYLPGQDPKHRRDLACRCSRRPAWLGPGFCRSGLLPTKPSLHGFAPLGWEHRIRTAPSVVRFLAGGPYSVQVGPVGDVGSRQPIRGWCRRTAQQGRQSGCIRPRKPGQLACCAAGWGGPQGPPSQLPTVVGSVAGRVDRVDVAGRVEGGWECPPVCLSRCVSHRPLGCIPCI